MPWLQLTIEAARDDAQRLSEALEEAGAVSVSLEGADSEPLFETDWHDTHPVWKQARVVALFEESAEVPAALAAAMALLGRTDIPPHTIDTLEDQDWVRAWMDRWQPMHFGGDLWVIPSWLTPPEPDATNLVLDPGMAFGTGTHATTALCLEWLANHPPYGRDVIDVGCGSGILAIAACLLGCTHAAAIDIDPQALSATRANAQRNGITPEQLTVTEPGALDAGGYAVILANILANPLIELAPRIAALTAPGGRLCLSGILESQCAAVRDAYAPWFDFAPPTVRESWARLAGCKTR